MAFKRFFELTPYILILPKIYIKYNKNNKYINCLSYFFKYSYPFFKNLIFSNLICLSFFEKISFLKSFNLYSKKYFNIKCANLSFTSFSFINFNFFSVLTSKKFFLKLKYFYFHIYKYIYTFFRYFKNIK